MYRVQSALTNILGIKQDYVHPILWAGSSVGIATDYGLDGPG